LAIAALMEVVVVAEQRDLLYCCARLDREDAGLWYDRMRGLQDLLTLRTRQDSPPTTQLAHESTAASMGSTARDALCYLRPSTEIPRQTSCYMKRPDGAIGGQSKIRVNSLSKVAGSRARPACANAALRLTRQLSHYEALQPDTLPGNLNILGMIHICRGDNKLKIAAYLRM